jgi:outer membrane protein insertion porin family
VSHRLRSVLSRPTALLAVALALLLAPGDLAVAQGFPTVAGPAAPRTYQVLGVTVEGTEDEGTRQFVLQTAGIREGQRLRIPGDETVSDAVRRLYNLGGFTDVDVIAQRFEGDGVHLLIRVEEAPRVGSIAFEGVRRSWADELRQQVPLLRGRALRPADLDRTEQVIEEYLAERGFRLARIDVAQTPAEGNRTDLTFRIDRGPRVEVGEVRFFGNEAVADARLRGRLQNTRERRWWRFWARDTFDEQEFQEDLDRLVRYYQDRGHFSARVVRDSVWTRTEGDRPEVVVDVHVEEGPIYHVRNVIFDGNTEYSDEQLRAALGVEPGEVFSRTKIERNLFYNRDHSDVYSLYQDRGYLRFNARERVVEVPGDSLDLVFEINEGDVYEFGQVTIRGNTRTKDHVIRRQLRTVPGTVYSRQAIERSVRELMQLNYFDPEQMAQGPRVAVNEESRTVDLTYNLVETGGDQLELSGGWGGSGYGLILQARVTFNNFSAQNLFRGEAWRPVPTGDGQQLSIGVQASGTRYQSYSLSFTEPYFRGRNTPVGFAVSYTYRDLNPSALFFDGPAPGQENTFRSISSRLFYRQQLTWPDDFFQLGTDLNYRLYDVTGTAFAAGFLPEGISQEVTVRQSLNRNSFDNPIFPTIGSSFSLSAEVAAPIGGFNQFHKEMLQTTWVTPVVGRLSLQFAGNFGYIGSLTGDPVEFQRFLVGGSPLDVQGSYLGYGKDLVFMRGYPLGVISPRRDGQLTGGRILNKYSMEARLFALQTAQFSFAPYLFADAANTWDSFGTYDPTRLYRSTGLGAKVFLPILGMLDINYGYALDSFIEPRTGEPSQPGWRFQFSIGQ